jgi:hypothetical protein
LLQGQLVKVGVLFFSDDSSVLLGAGFHINERSHHASEGYLPVLEHFWLVREARNYLLHNVESYLYIEDAGKSNLAQSVD